MKTWFLVICFLTSVSFGAELKLRDKLAEAEPGSYIVTEQNKNFTFLHVFDRTDNSIILEEVSIPAARYMRHPLPWRDWFECGAPGHTSWTMSQIDLNSGRFEETFSFTHQGWINLADSDPFLTTLLNLRFQALPEEKRRRIGLPPGYRKPDYRPIWNPPLFVNGKRITHVPFSVWLARWPCDGSDLSRKYIEIYLPYDSTEATYPSYFPYWIEVEGKIGSAKVRVIDSGTEARSPKPALPLRPPQLMGKGKLEADGLKFYIHSPSYYSDFMVMVEDENSLFGKTFPLRCEINRLDTETVQLFIPISELNEIVSSGESYRFTISPKENPHVCLISHL